MRIKKYVRVHVVVTLIFSLVFGNSLVALAGPNGTDLPYRDDSGDIQRSMYETQTNGVTGGLSYDYAIVLPPGRAKMTPDLSLRYSNQNTDDGNLFGYGWSDNIPYIERQNKRGSDQLYSTTYFYSSLDGELASTSADNYIARIEGGSFNQYTLSDNVWTVRDKSGNIFKFGSTTATQQNNPASSTQVYRWMLEEMRDTNDNYIKYEYSKDTGQIYPYRITYTGNATSDGPFVVEFLKQLRDDVSTTSEAAFDIVTKYRINEIRTYTGGTWARKYVLDYRTGNNGLRSLLATSTEYGRDEGGATTTIPATVFSYQVPTPGFTETPAFRSPVILLGINTGGASVDYGVRIVDISGDGLTDIIQAYQEGANYTYHSYINTGNGYIEDPAWNLPMPVTYGWSGVAYDQGVRLYDANGDGRTDVIQHLATFEQTSTSTHAYINNGHGFTEDATWNSPTPFTKVLVSASKHTDPDVKVLDINGDGLLDIIFAQDRWTGSSYNLVTHSYINTGKGYEENDLWDSPVAFMKYPSDDVAEYGRDTGVRLFDINGDRLTDIIESYVSTSTQYRRSFINTGTGFLEEPMWRLPSTTPFIHLDAFQEIHDYGYRVMDINADGLPDLVGSYSDGNPAFYEKETRLNTGSGFGPDVGAWDFPIVFMDFHSGRYRGAQAVDLDGDTLEDAILRYGGEGGSGENYAYINTGNRADLLSKVTLGTGGTIGYTYKASSEYMNGSTTTSPLLPFAVQTVEKVVKGDGLGLYGTTTYSYAGGEFSYSSTTPFDRKLSGFGTTTETDAVGNITRTFYHQGNGINSLLGENADHVSKIGRAFRTERRDASGNLFNLEVNTWDRSAINANSDYIKLGSTTVLSYDGDSDHKDKAEEYFYNNSNGNVSSKVSWGEVSASSNGSFTDAGTDKLVQTNIYATGTTAYIASLPATTTVRDQSGNRVSESRYYYDNQSIGSVNKGNLTRQENWKVDSTYVGVEKDYNSYGLVTEERDPRSKTTDFVYDPYKLYPATTTNALNHTYQYWYDYSLGKPKTTLNADGFYFQTTYDGLDRVVTEIQPGQVYPYSSVTKTSYDYTDTSLPSKTKRTDHLSSATSTETHTYFDGLKRSIQVRKQSEDPSIYSVMETVYDEGGMKKKEALPYFASGSTYNSPSASSYLYTTYAYDALGRATTTANVLGTTTFAFDQWSTTVTDANGEVKDLLKDSFDRLTSVIEHNSGSSYTTSYEYNGLGNLTKVTDAFGNIRNFTYDGLGRRLTAEDLHNSGDTTFGTWTYGYDDAGNLTSRLDPKSQTIHYSYDDLNRLSTEDYTGLSGTEATYSYDSCFLGKGRLCSSVIPTVATTSFQYTSLGQVYIEVKQIAGTAYSNAFEYDYQGNPTLIVYPDGRSVAYNYNTAGLLDSIGTYVRNIDYSPHGQVSHVTFGNNASSTTTYDPSKLYRVIYKGTEVGANTVQDIAYTYDAVGNITKTIDNAPVTGKTVDYTYDDLHRLLTASTTGAVAGADYLYTYAYDAIGNMTSNSDIGSYTYYSSSDTGKYANPSALKTAGGTTNYYDFNGNLSSTSASRTYTWDHNNRMIQSVVAGATSTYLYEPSGKRVQTNVGGVITRYFNKYFDTVNSTTTDYIYGGDTLYATVEKGPAPSQSPAPSGSPAPSPLPAPNITHYNHGDHLQSVGATTNDQGTTDELTDYYPYGKVRQDITYSNFTQKHKYIDKYLDTETGLNYLEARYQDPRLGVFTSLDPVFLGMGDVVQVKSKTGLVLQQYLSDPQDMNSYSYGKNNPMKFSDPTGNVSTMALFNPFTYLQAGIGFFASDVYSSLNPGSKTTTQLFNRSLSLNPGPVSIAENNNYSYVVDQIKNSSEYKSFINQAISSANDTGVTSINAVYKGNISGSSGNSINFTKGDLFTSIGGTLSTQIVGSKQNGTWNINVGITDRYDFQLKGYNNPVANTLNNAALVPQAQGVISNYDIRINFKDKK